MQGKPHCAERMSHEKHSHKHNSQDGIGGEGSWHSAVEKQTKYIHYVRMWRMTATVYGCAHTCTPVCAGRHTYSHTHLCMYVRIYSVYGKCSSEFVHVQTYVRSCVYKQYAETDIWS